MQAIDEYFKMLSHPSKSSTIYGMLKLLPLWVVRLALGSGLLLGYAVSRPGLGPGYGWGYGHNNYNYGRSR